ncbi:MAG: hypothetical protein FJ298_14270 [Planctomycetes bacterium]|nr:hypothetical protein [Planctomycetota bacterium]
MTKTKKKPVRWVTTEHTGATRPPDVPVWLVRQGWNEICEAWTLADARRIARALNAMEVKKGRSK